MFTAFVEIYREAVNSVWEMIRPNKVRRVARFDGPGFDHLYLPVRGRVKRGAEPTVVDPASAELISPSEALARVDEFQDENWIFHGVEKYRHQPLIPRVVRDTGR